MVESMTGFAKSEAFFSAFKVEMSIRTLNSKGIDINLKVPQSINELEIDLQKLIKQKLKRGSIDCFIRIEPIEQKDSAYLNVPLIKQYVQQFQEIDANLSTAELVKIALNRPVVYQQDTPELGQEEKNTLVEYFNELITKLNEFRRKDGEALLVDFEERLQSLRENLKGIIEVNPSRIEKIRKKLQDAVKNQAIDYNENKLEEELIYYIEKLDINEEVVRLKSHLNYFEEILKEQDSQGKKLLFVSQEMGREINTIGSKANDKNVQMKVVQLKDDLEKIKEQLANVV